MEGEGRFGDVREWGGGGEKKGGGGGEIERRRGMEGLNRGAKEGGRNEEKELILSHPPFKRPPQFSIRVNPPDPCHPP